MADWPPLQKPVSSCPEMSRLKLMSCVALPTPATGQLQHVHQLPGQHLCLCVPRSPVNSIIIRATRQEIFFLGCNPNVVGQSLQSTAAARRFCQLRATSGLQHTRVTTTKSSRVRGRREDRHTCCVTRPAYVKGTTKLDAFIESSHFFALLTQSWSQGSGWRTRTSEVLHLRTANPVPTFRPGKQTVARSAD